MMWTVEKRRSTPAGGVLNLLVSENGAKRWLHAHEVRESFEFVPALTAPCDCATRFDCCSCGIREDGCGCPYCWDCNACDECYGERASS